MTFEQSPRGSEKAILERNVPERSSKCKGQGQDMHLCLRPGRHQILGTTPGAGHHGPSGKWRNWDLASHHHLCPCALLHTY